MPRAHRFALPPPATTSPERARDRALLARVAEGGPGALAALRTLYDEHAARALATAQRILKSEAEAEDVVQETFIEIWRRAATYDQDRAGAAAWIVTIARSRAIDRLRSTASAARAALAAAAAAGLTTGDGPNAGGLAALGPGRGAGASGGATRERGGASAATSGGPIAAGALASMIELMPDRLAERAAERERVGRALASLPPEQRKVVTLAFYEGLSQREIAAATGSPLGTVKMRVRLAMAKLAVLLDDDDGA